MWTLKHGTKEPIYKTETDFTDIENRLMVAKVTGSGMDGEFGVSRCKLLNLEWISNEVLPICTWSLGIDHDGR